MPRNRRWCRTIIIILVAAVLLSPVSIARAAEDLNALVSAYNRAGLQLFDNLAESQGNLVISPYSIGTAMTMARMGARGDTESEMAKVLGPTGARSDVAQAAGQLSDQLKTRASDDGHRLGNANALHLTKFGELVADSYKALLQDKFGAEVFAGSDLGTINAWVRDKTNGKIEKILQRLNPLSVCVLLNAIAFKADWAAAFDPQQTSPGDFRLRRDETITVPMMRRTGAYRILRAHAFDAIALPFKGGELAMVIVLPMPVSGTFPIPPGLGADTYRAVMRGLEDTEPERVRLHMPRFKLEAGADLIPPFKALGMELAFDKDHADFTGITESTREEDRIHITQIQHKAVIEVNEAGTEAAAATAVEMGVRSAAPPTREYKIDWPFLFFVADRITETILFMGRVSEPEAFEEQAAVSPAALPDTRSAQDGSDGQKPARKEFGRPPREASPQTRLARLGGRCAYDNYRGQCRIVSVKKTAASMRQAAVGGSAGYEGYDVRFTYSGELPDDSKLAGHARDQQHRLRLTNSWYPGPRYLKKYGIAEGERFSCTLKVPTNGSCPPILFDFPAINQSDYFESAER